VHFLAAAPNDAASFKVLDWSLSILFSAKSIAGIGKVLVCFVTTDGAEGSTAVSGDVTFFGVITVGT